MSSVQNWTKSNKNTHRRIRHGGFAAINHITGKVQRGSGHVNFFISVLITQQSVEFTVNKNFCTSFLCAWFNWFLTLMYKEGLLYINKLYSFYSTAPNPVRNIKHHLDSQNITFEWPRPEGRIDYYTILWWNDLTPEKKVMNIPSFFSTQLHIWWHNYHSW